MPFQIMEETLVIKDKNAPQGYREEEAKSQAHHKRSGDFRGLAQP